MDTVDERLTAEEQKLFRGILYLNSKVLGLVLGLICGLVIFIATNWLVIKGGETVGLHLQMLDQFFIGYRVTFFGSFIGFAYGFAVGTLSGAIIGWIYNKIVLFRNSGK